LKKNRLAQNDLPKRQNIAQSGHPGESNLSGKITAASTSFSANRFDEINLQVSV
jgi:hypothetical protein